MSSSMDSSNMSSSSTCVVDDVDANDNIPPMMMSSIFMHHYFASFVDHHRPSSESCLLLGLGTASALLYAMLWLVRRYGPYVFTEARSPSHRNPSVPSDRLLTRIHGKWHDLTKFDHPGGPIALSLVHLRDGTALFESHHPFVDRKYLMRTLAKYEVPHGRRRGGKEEEEEENDDDDDGASSSSGCVLMDPRDDGSVYDWSGVDKRDGFASDLRHFVRSHFASIAMARGVSVTCAAKATPGRWVLVLSLMTSFFASLPRYVSGDWTFLFVTPLLAWVTAVNYWHDGLHFGLSTDWRVNAWLPYLFPYYSSPWTWYHEHVIGHHAYPNVDHKDPDLAHAPQLMREHDSVRWRDTHVGQTRFHRVLFVWSVALGVGLSLLSDARANVKLSYNNVVPYASLSRSRLAAHVLGRMIYVFLMHVWPYLTFPLWKATIWATIPGMLLSVCFMINTQVNHLTCDCAHASDVDFYKHQVVTAQNFGNDSLFCYYFSGGLNYQIEHHLFPTVNHCHLPALSRGVRMICEKHGVPYHLAAGYRDAMRRHMAHTLEMEKRPTT